MDISLCFWRDTCSRAPLCYRATAEPGEWHQSWFAPTDMPRNPGDECRYFMPITSEWSEDNSQ